MWGTTRIHFGFQLFFLNHINELANAFKQTLPILFTYDTNLFINSKNLDDVTVLVNNELEKNFYIWLKAEAKI